MRIGKANGEDWLRLGEAAAILGVSLNTVRRWSDAGKLTCYRSPGGHRRYRRHDVESLLKTEDGGLAAPVTAGPAGRSSGASDLEDLRAPLLALARVAAEGVGVTNCRISLVEGDGRLWTVTAPEGETPPGAERTADAPPVVGEVLRTGRRLVIADLSTTTLLGRREAHAHLERGDAAVLAVPLSIGGRYAGVMELAEGRAPRSFDGANVAFAEFMARQAARRQSF